MENGIPGWDQRCSRYENVDLSAGNGWVVQKLDQREVSCPPPL